MAKKEFYTIIRKILADCRRRNCEFNELLKLVNEKPNKHTEEVKYLLTILDFNIQVELSRFATVQELIKYSVKNIKFKKKDKFIFNTERVGNTCIYHLIFVGEKNFNGRYDSFIIKCNSEV